MTQALRERHCGMDRPDGSAAAVKGALWAGRLRDDGVDWARYRLGPEEEQSGGCPLLDLIQRLHAATVETHPESRGSVFAPVLQSSRRSSVSPMDDRKSRTIRRSRRRSGG